ncbi:MAG: heavy metal-associated domain-containing protein [Bacteroidota bacterium]
MKNAITAVIFLISALVGCGKSATPSNVNVATIQLPTLKCKTCVRTIKNALASVEGMEGADVDLESKRVTVKFVEAKLDVSKIRAAISAAGYDADDVKRDSAAYENLSECCK